MNIKKVCLTFFLAASAAVPVLAAPPKLVVTILVDQMRYDYLERFGDQFSTNGFRMLTERGALMTFARYDYAPTVTGPGHASFLSGSTPAMHGIIANEWYDKRLKTNQGCVQDLSVWGVGGASPTNGRSSPVNFIGATFCDQMRLHYGSKVVGVSLKDRAAILPVGKQPTGAYWIDAKSGNFITSTYYRKTLPEWVDRFNGEKRIASYAGKTWERMSDAPAVSPALASAPQDPALHGSTGFPHRIAESAKDGALSFETTPLGNQLVVEFAEAAIEGESLGSTARPDVLSVSFSSTDLCGHKFGPYSPEMHEIMLSLDRQLESFFGYLDKRIGLSNIVVALTADHGVCPTPEFAAAQGLAGENFDLAGKLVELTNKLSLKFGAGSYLLTTKDYEGNLYFNHSTMSQNHVTDEQMVSYIREWAFDLGKISAVYSREQLLGGNAPGLMGRLVLNGYNPERCGDMVLILKPFILSGGSKGGTTHGSPFNYDSHVPVIFYGTPFKTGRYAEVFNITDLAPTLCAALHVEEPPGCMGKPFVKALLTP